MDGNKGSRDLRLPPAAIGRTWAFLFLESNMVCVNDMYTVHIDVLYSTIWNVNRCHKRCTMMYRAPYFGSRGMDRMGGFLSFRDRAAEAIPGAEEAENPADTVFRRRFSSFFSCLEAHAVCHASLP